MAAKVHPYFEAILKEDELVAKYDLDVAERTYVPDKIKDLYQGVSKLAIHVISSDRSKHDKGRKLLQSLNVQVPATADDLKESNIDLAKGLADTTASWGSWNIKGFKIAARSGLNRTDRPLALLGSSFGLPISTLEDMIHSDTMSYVDLVSKDIDGVIESYDQTSRGLTEMEATLRRLAVLFAGTPKTPSLAPHTASLVLLEINSHRAYWNATLAPTRRMLPEFDAAVETLAKFSEQVFNTTKITNEELAGWQRMRKRIGCQLRKRGWVKRDPPRNWTPTAGSCKLTASKWRESMAYMQQQREIAEARAGVVWAESFELSRLQQKQAIHEEYYREQEKKKQKRRWF
ncbi:hypothetical protein TI39_contig354g00005 [Zymoseptoria brevis]|uniref:Uncharacterized protein n=1 Tax=Zymoseptoria brevis TaxID=1047168 RepID=A0A0F4GQA9_9PEZI|nr:hypothetical protein TI39_contig354g00005 [Zymoseptoria brevis]